MGDPQIGRFIEIDPLANDYVYNSTYAFSENKVTAHIELEGRESIPINPINGVVAGIANIFLGWNNDLHEGRDKFIAGANEKAASDMGEYKEQNTLAQSFHDANGTMKMNEGVLQMTKPGLEAANMVGGSVIGVELAEAPLVVGTSQEFKGLLSLESTTVASTERAAGNSPSLTITEVYKRPSGTPTAAQRASVQGQPCVDCGVSASKMVADHKIPLVQEYYQTGTINRVNMNSLNAVQPQCPTCSARQGAAMSQYSKFQKIWLGLK